MNERYLLDTGVASLAAQGAPAIVRRISQGQSVYIPRIVYGELYFGAYRYARLHNSAKFLDLYDQLARNPRYKTLPLEHDTATIYGAIRAELEAKGQMIQLNDIWIAALARQHGLTLLTRDSDFARISRLNYESV